MARRDTGEVGARSDAERVDPLLDLIDLVGRHTRLDELLRDLAARLGTVAQFDGISVVLPADAWTTAHMHSVRLGTPDAGAGEARVESLVVEPLDPQGLAAAGSAREAGIVLDRLDPGGDYPGVIAALRGLGQRSAYLLPIATPHRPVGLLSLSSSREGAYGRCDRLLLQRIGAPVAVAIEHLLRHDEARALERQLLAERDHWHALLDLNNAIATTRDLASLLSAIAPDLHTLVPHDDANLFLLQPGGRTVGLYAISPLAVGWTDELTSEIQPDTEPFATWLNERRTVDMDYEQLDWTGREAIRDNLKSAGVKRACFAPLATTHGTLGFIVLNRRSDDPFTPDELLRSSRAAAQVAIALENAIAFGEITTLTDRLARENIYLGEEIRGRQHFGEIVGESPALERILNQVRTVAATDATVLLLGETGTGKELIARAIHSASTRRDRTLVTVNCATSPAGLLESEWFGHEKGAFTGALAQKVGRFELAHQGTLFLDEIGDVPLDLQSKLLRVLQEHEIERLGSTRTMHVDFRLIAATNRNLDDMVQAREFRSDLFYRLNVFPILIPPLRERREDIPPLVRYFVQRFAKRLRRPIECVSRETMDLLCRWEWPGNVRELQNVIERAVILTQGSTLTVPPGGFEPTSLPTHLPVTLEAAERDHILRALEQTGWVIGGDHGAAARLGVKRTSLVSTMKRLGIVRPKLQAGRRQLQTR